MDRPRPIIQLVTPNVFKKVKEVSKMKMTKKNGFTLVEILMAVSVLAFLAVILMKIISRNTNTALNLKNSYQIESLKNEMIFILKGENDCRVSFAGEITAPGPRGEPVTPITFYKLDHDGYDTAGNNIVGEGLPIIIALSNPAGTSVSTIKFQDNDKYFGLVIETIRLVFRSMPVANYSENIVNLQHQDYGELRVKVRKKIGNDVENTVTFNIRLNFYLKTDASNLTTILSCSRIPDQINYDDFCALTGKKFNITRLNYCE